MIQNRMSTFHGVGINKQNGNTVSYLIEYSQLLKTWDSVDVDSGDHDPYF